MEKNFVIGMLGIAVIALLSIAAVRFPAQVTAQVVGNQNGQPGSSATVDQSGRQVVQLSYQNYNYYPNNIYLKVGVPARIVVDTDKVKGCMTTIVIPSLGIRKTVRPGDNVIEFTPTTEGTIPFSCVMGMGRGQFIVTRDSQPTSPTSDTYIRGEGSSQPAADPAPSLPQGSSCGSGGGCGCGGAR